MTVYLRRRLRGFAVAIPAAALAVFSGLPASAGLAHGAYQQTNLVSDGAVPAQHTDSHLKNPWGISGSPSSPFWVSDNATGVTTLYANGNPVFLDPATNPHQFVVTIPPPLGSLPGTTSSPTGTVFNGTSDFQVAPGKPARFLFATEDGTISGWNPMVDFNNAILKVDNSGGGAGAVYKGLALGSVGSAHFLYVSNFRAAVVERYDTNFAFASAFTDPAVPAGFAPFNVQSDADIGGSNPGWLWVTFAKQNAEMHDDVAGPGNGFVDLFDTSGNLLRRFAAHGSLNSPWGLAIAPAGFGPFHGDLLVGNFGDGTINAFNLRKGKFHGQLGDGTGGSITNDSLWGLRFGNGGAGGPKNTLFFTAGINHEADGLYGSIVSLEN
ncbi:MAG TPA: TIGR03118 family protein [Arthrobacter bacterium]|jgi:uncharacterized protein (TIGR03118 family)|nr:TIGR03118 family protein [Arthrobacter sp.]